MSGGRVLAVAVGVAVVRLVGVVGVLGVGVLGVGVLGVGVLVRGGGAVPAAARVGLLVRA